MTRTLIESKQSTLGCICKRQYVMLFFWLEYYALDFHPFTWNFKFYDWMIFHCLWCYIHYPFINWWISRINYYALIRDEQISLQQNVESFGFMSRNSIAVWCRGYRSNFVAFRSFNFGYFIISIFVYKNQYQYLQKIQLILWENTEWNVDKLSVS